MQAGLGAVAGGHVEVGMPADGHGLGFAADVLRHDDGVDGIGGQGDGEVEIGLGEPVAAEVAGMDDAGDFFAAGNVFHVTSSVLAFRMRPCMAWRSAPGFLPMLFAGRVRCGPATRW